MKIIVYHASYGCDTGCCGHVVKREGESGDFIWEHPWGREAFEFAKKLVRDEWGEKHVADLDFENSVIVDDC